VVFLSVADLKFFYIASHETRIVGLISQRVSLIDPQVPALPFTLNASASHSSNDTQKNGAPRSIVRMEVAQSSAPLSVIGGPQNQSSQSHKNGD
jgi:hypothetical protein